MNDSNEFYTNSNDRKVLVRCSCGIGCWCGELGLQLCDDEDNEFGFWAEVFIGPLWEWKMRFERAWEILMGRPFSVHLVLSKEDSARLANWILEKQNAID